MNNEFDRGKIARDWWNDWINPQAEGKGRGNRRAVAAELRRSHSALEALMHPATMNLLQRLGGRANTDRVGVLAAVLAHVREDDSRAIGRALGPQSLAGDTATNNESALLKEGRLRRLLQTENDELLDQFRRMVQLMGPKVNIANLASLILYWGDKAKKDLIFDYYDMRRDASETPSAA